MSIFKTFAKDSKTTELIVQGARSANSNNDVVTLRFQNYDDDTHLTYDMAHISILDHFGNSASNGYGDIVLSTFGGNSQNKNSPFRITYNGNIGIGEIQTPETLSLLTTSPSRLNIINGDIALIGSNSKILFRDSSNNVISTFSANSFLSSNTSTTTDPLNINNATIQTLSTNYATFSNIYISSNLIYSTFAASNASFSNVYVQDTLSFTNVNANQATFSNISTPSSTIIQATFSNISTSNLYSQNITNTNNATFSNISTSNLQSISLISTQSTFSNVSTSNLTSLQTLVTPQGTFSNISTSNLQSISLISTQSTFSNVSTSNLTSLQTLVTPQGTFSNISTSNLYSQNITNTNNATFSNINASNLFFTQQLRLNGSNVTPKPQTLETIASYTPGTKFINPSTTASNVFYTALAWRYDPSRQDLPTHVLINSYYPVSSNNATTYTLRIVDVTSSNVIWGDVACSNTNPRTNYISLNSNAVASISNLRHLELQLSHNILHKTTPVIINSVTVLSTKNP